MNTDDAHRFVRTAMADKEKPQISLSLETVAKLTADRDIIQELIRDVRALLAAYHSNEPMGTKTPEIIERDLKLLQNLQSDLDDFDTATALSAK